MSGTSSQSTLSRARERVRVRASVCQENDSSVEWPFDILPRKDRANGRQGLNNRSVR